VVGYYNVGDRMKVWGKDGRLLGWAVGDFSSAPRSFGSRPGATTCAGPLVSWIVGALEGAIVVGGLSAIEPVFNNLGIPKDSILRYETALKADKFVLIAHGSPDDNSCQGNPRPDKPEPWSIISERRAGHDVPFPLVVARDLTSPLQRRCSARPAPASRLEPTTRKLPSSPSFERTTTARRPTPSLR